MRVALQIVMACILISRGFGDDKSVADSECSNKRYSVTFEYPAPEKSYPKVFLTDHTTNKKEVLIDFEEFGVYHTFGGSYWSPDGRYVVIGTEIERTLSVDVFHVSNGEAVPVELLPIPKALDKEPTKIRGGDVFDRWQDSNTLWLLDTSKHRYFRYRFTKQGKLLADKYKDDE